MNKDEILNGIQAVREKLAELETAAGKLENKNYADIVKSARGRLHQLTQHPDTKLVAAEMSKMHDDAPATKEEAIARMAADHDADPEGTARMNWPLLFDGPETSSTPFPNTDSSQVQ